MNVGFKNSNYSIKVVSVPDRNKLVAEVWLGPNMIAEINEEGPQMAIEFYPTQQTLDLAELLDALQRGRQRLI